MYAPPAGDPRLPRAGRDRDRRRARTCASAPTVTAARARRAHRPVERHRRTARRRSPRGVVVSGIGGLCQPLDTPQRRPASSTSRARPSTPPSGTTTSTSTGKRVAVIGTGASAIQFVPRIAPQVASSTSSSAPPPWIIPKRDRPITRLERALYRRVPSPSAPTGGSSTGRSSRACSAFSFEPRIMKLAERLAPPPHPPPDRAIPSCAQAVTPELRDGLQADPDLQRLLPGARPRQRRGRHRRDPRVHRDAASSPPTAASARSTRSSTAPASRSHDMLSGFEVTRPRRRRPRARSGPSAACRRYRGHHRGRLPQPVHPARARTPGSATTRSSS